MRDIIDVSQLNRFAKSILAADDRMNDLIVCGEITNFKKQYSSGHCYFTLRDENVTCRKVFVMSCKRLEKKLLLVIKYILYNSSIFATEKSFF